MRAAEVCAGSGAAPTETRQRIGGGTLAVCAVCNRVLVVTPSGLIRRHDATPENDLHARTLVAAWNVAVSS